MYQPYLSEGQTSRVITDTFLGYNHNNKIDGAEAYDELNISSDLYPLFSQRKRRGTIKTLTYPQGIIVKDNIAYVDNGKLYVMDASGDATDTGLILDSVTEKQLVSMGSYICIFPDAMYFNTADSDDKGSMGMHIAENVQISLALCTVTGDEIEADYVQSNAPTSPANGAYWIDTSKDIHGLYVWDEINSMWNSIATCYVKVAFGGSHSWDTLPDIKQYDAVNIDGLSYTGATTAMEKQVSDLNGSQIVYATGTDSNGDFYMCIVGILDETYTAYMDITLDRKIPQLDFVIEAQNRLWGCRYGTEDGVTYNEIRCCALGDFRNWERFMGISTDSYVANVGSDGEWTGAVNYLGYPTFFKENTMHRVTVSATGAHSVTETKMRGVQKGSSKSLAVVNEVLYYKARGNEVCAYQGSFPDNIGRPLGEEKYYNGIGGVLNGKYYLCLDDAEDNQYMFVFDTERGIWHRESAINISQFAWGVDRLVAVTADKLISIDGNEGNQEDKFHWEMTTGIMYYEYPDHKYVSRYNFRLELSPGAYMNVLVEYDSNGVWQRVASFDKAGRYSETKPIRPRRCDHMRMKLEGYGEVKIYSIVKTLEQGSDRR